ncbi:MAG TPA: AAA family ATPase [Pseudomonadales bacterium]|nr:AAA family ATPase [Pseudomonadales bacterium]
MYQEHFQLKTQPFSEHAAATSLWVDSRMQEGLARLNYLADSATLGLVTGPSGCGKSALLKRFLHELSRQRCEPVYCHLTHLNSTGLLKSLILKLGEVPKLGKERLFEQILQRAARNESTLLLIIDEAHLLDGEALTDLRLLVSSAVDTAPPLKLLLTGQETLRSTLKRSQLGDLLNRIQVHYRLKPLSKEQTGRYIDVQMKQAGGPEDVFDTSVKELIHDFTGGLPRAINNLATACLLQAVARNVLRIDEPLFQQTSTEFHLG